MRRLIPMAICYDFDGTLVPGNMQEYGFIKKLNMTPSEFWNTANGLAKKQKGDEILTYMKTTIDESRKRNLPITREDFKSYGKDITFFEGVETYFGRINRYAKSKGVKLQHFIISSGLKEMLEGTAIAHEFTEIFASTFLYDETGAAVWPAMVLNYTSKTQYIYRINKGCLDRNSGTPLRTRRPRPVGAQRKSRYGSSDRRFHRRRALDGRDEARGTERSS